MITVNIIRYFGEWAQVTYNNISYTVKREHLINDNGTTAEIDLVHLIETRK